MTGSAVVVALDTSQPVVVRSVSPASPHAPIGESVASPFTDQPSSEFVAKSPLATPPATGQTDGGVATNVKLSNATRSLARHVACSVNVGPLGDPSGAMHNENEPALSVSNVVNEK